LPFKKTQKLASTLLGLNEKEGPDPTWDMGFMELIHSFGYKAEEHYVQTKDGYILGVHRIPPKEGQKCRGVVFFQHGFMQSSEAFIIRGPKKALPLMLVDVGFDVWLGNNRGNKYSYKHLQHSPKEDAFWDFCLDDFALGDLPAMIGYILTATGVNSISYIGFSQGTAQAFAAFSTNDKLAERINLFIALAPAARVNHLSNQMVAALTTSRPDMVFLLFGKKALLGETLFWRRVLSSSLYVWLIDVCLSFLFGWKTSELNPKEKSSLYSHIYSYSSVKCLVHWFQITRTKRFQMYDGNIAPASEFTYANYLLPCYQPSRIKCPIAIFYGGKDTVPDMKYLLDELPPATYIHKEDNYEHLDFMWATSAPERIFVKVIDLLLQSST